MPFACLSQGRAGGVEVVQPGPRAAGRLAGPVQQAGAAMKTLSATPAKKGRIEIIPLIDVMFFLLAAFMLSSLAMIRLRSIEMSLPTATVPGKHQPDVIDLLVKPNGDLYVGETNYNVVALQYFLSNRFRLNPRLQVYIKANPASTYGMFINALDLVRQVGIPSVSCAIPQPSRPTRSG